ncbi:MAG: hypothetical protein R3A79_13115 [Nannocystaceae bacterium]
MAPEPNASALLVRAGDADPSQTKARARALVTAGRDADAYILLLDFVERHAKSVRRSIEPLWRELGTKLAAAEAKLLTKVGNDYRFATQRSRKKGEHERWDLKIRSRVLEEPRPVVATHLANSKRPSKAYLQAIPRFECCTFLSLSSCVGVSAEALAIVAAAPRLRELVLFSSDADDGALAEIAAIPTLERLDLGYCAGVTGSGFVHLAALERLSILELNTTGIKEAYLQHLIELPSLRALNLVRCQGLSRRGVEHIAAIPTLEELDLTATYALTDDDIAPLADHPNLRRLKLGLTRLTDAGLARLSAAPRLEEVNVDSTDVTEAGREAFLAAVRGRAPAEEAVAKA